MKTLPKLLISLFIFLIPLFLVVQIASAQNPPPPAAPPPPAPAGPPPPPAGPPPPPPAPLQGGQAQVQNPTCQPGEWCEDGEVTFAGKIAARSAEVLNWVIKNHEWAQVNQTTLSTQNPFDEIWKRVRNVVYMILGLFILAAAFLIIYTRGENITIRKFIPRFVAIILLVTLSYSIIQFLYAITDIIQGFFFKAPDGDVIQDDDLLSISFGYKDFRGFRRFGPQFEESAMISLILTKLTAATYFVMFMILIIRKIILWFFIIVSPIFPLLIFFYPLRNTAKIWVGEFFRWLLYGPLFAVFLGGLVALWQIYIPLDLNRPCGQAQPEADPTVLFPTSINILLGGPCQVLFFDGTNTNNINIPESFIQYVVALLMLWMVIIMPFILLRIFLDYLNHVTGEGGSLAKYFLRPNNPPPGSKPGKPLAPPPGFGIFKHNPVPPPPPAGAGLARELYTEAFSEAKDSAIQPVIQQAQITQSAIADTGMQAQSTIRSVTESAVSGMSQISASAGGNVKVTSLETDQLNAQMLNLAGISIPTMKDITRYETAMLSGQSMGKEEVHRIQEALNRISGSSTIVTPGEKEKFTAIKERLQTESQGGNAIAGSVLAAAGARPGTKVSSIGGTGGAGPEGGAPGGGAIKLPEQNKVQQVSLEDYEEVRKTWMDNYSKLDVPPGAGNEPRTRIEWIEEEVKKISQTLELLKSQEDEKIKLGMEMVSQILPFLLLGGFSRPEIAAYLKAKNEAAKAVLEQLKKEEAKNADEDSMVEVDRKREEKPKQMMMEASVPSTESAGKNAINAPTKPHEGN